MVHEVCEPKADALHRAVVDFFLGATITGADVDDGTEPSVEQKRGEAMELGHVIAEVERCTIEVGRVATLHCDADIDDAERALDAQAALQFGSLTNRPETAEVNGIENHLAVVVAM